MAEFDRLAQVLFGGAEKAADFKTMPGVGSEFTRDELADELLRSMERMGLVQDGKLINPNHQQN